MQLSPTRGWNKQTPESKFYLMNTLHGLAFYLWSSISLGMFWKQTVKKQSIQLLHIQLYFQQLAVLANVKYRAKSKTMFILISQENREEPEYKTCMLICKNK